MCTMYEYNKMELKGIVHDGLRKLGYVLFPLIWFK